MAVAFEPLNGFWMDLERSWSLLHCLFHKLLSPTVWAWQHRKVVGGKGWINQSMTKVFVEQPLASPGSAKYLFLQLNIYKVNKLSLKLVLVIWRKKLVRFFFFQMLLQNKGYIFVIFHIFWYYIYVSFLNSSHIRDAQFLLRRTT